MSEILVAAGGAAALAVLLRVRALRHRAERGRELRYIQRLEKAQDFLQRHIARLDALLSALPDMHQLGMSGARPASKPELCQIILDHACQIVPGTRGALLLADLENLLTVSAARGLDDSVKSVRLRAGEGIAGGVAETGKPLWVEDLRTDKRFLRDAQPPLESRSMAAVALRAKSRSVGVIVLHGPAEGRVFEEREIQLLQILADHAAVILENFELYENLQKFSFEMVQTLSRVMDVKNMEHAAELGRARQLVRGLAKELHLPPPLAQHVEYAALIHDVGKIGVEEKILRKPGKLTKEEYAKVKQHPEIASRILAPVDFLAPVTPIILYHQEWYNGKGYPEGLKGEEIPLGARIVAVIDAWEAMTSDRPYRKAMTPAQALKELEDGAGTQFDPKVVEAFQRVLKKARQEPAA